MNFIEMLMWMIAMLCGAILATEIAYNAVLAQQVKKWLFMDENFLKWHRLSLRKTYEDLDWYLQPFRVIIQTIGFIMNEIQLLVNCPFCVAFHLGWIINIFMFQMQIIPSIILGTFCLGMVFMWRKITLKQ